MGTALQSQSCTGDVVLWYSSNGAFQLNLAEGSLGVKLQVVGFPLEIRVLVVLRLKEAEKLCGKDSFVFSSIGKLVLTPGEM